MPEQPVLEVRDFWKLIGQRATAVTVVTAARVAKIPRERVLGNMVWGNDNRREDTCQLHKTGKCVDLSVYVRLVNIRQCCEDSSQTSARPTIRLELPR